MTNSEEINPANTDTLEIHYWFSDGTHTMDAIIQNKCDYEVLAVIKEVTKLLSIEITVETEALGIGGLRKWLKIVLKEENQKGTITTSIIASLISILLVTPLTKVTEKVFEKIFEDKEINDLQKQKLKLEIEQLKQEKATSLELIDKSSLIKKRRSNFYETLDKYPKVDKVSFSVIDNSKESKSNDYTVVKRDFSSFVLTTDDLEPLEVEEGIIEIIAPVLKKGNYKWIGYYNGEVVPFNMKSGEFKSLVQNGKIEFKNGSSINCYLKIRRKINSEGLEINIGYDVTRVNKYFENDTPIETKEGKYHRQIKEAQKNQLKLFKEGSEENNH